MTPTVFVLNALVNGDFEQGADVGWISAGSATIINNPSFSESGFWAAILGGASKGDATITQVVTIPANAPYVAYGYTTTSGQTDCFRDSGFIRVDTTPNDATVGTIAGAVQEFCQERQHPYYREGVVDLRAYAGQTVALQFDMSTQGGIASNWTIDNVFFRSTPQ